METWLVDFVLRRGPLVGLSAFLGVWSRGRISLLSGIYALAIGKMALHLLLALIRSLLLLLAAIVLQYRDCGHACLLLWSFILNLAWRLIQLFLRLKDRRQVRAQIVLERHGAGFIVLSWRLSCSALILGNAKMPPSACHLRFTFINLW